MIYSRKDQALFKMGKQCWQIKERKCMKRIQRSLLLTSPTYPYVDWHGSLENKTEITVRLVLKTVPGVWVIMFCAGNWLATEHVILPFSFTLSHCFFTHKWKLYTDDVKILWYFHCTLLRGTRNVSWSLENIIMNSKTEWMNYVIKSLKHEILKVVFMKFTISNKSNDNTFLSGSKNII